jgi:hypothetical protein
VMAEITSKMDPRARVEVQAGTPQRQSRIGIGVKATKVQLCQSLWSCKHVGCKCEGTFVL